MTTNDLVTALLVTAGWTNEGLHRYSPERNTCVSLGEGCVVVWHRTEPEDSIPSRWFKSLILETGRYTAEYIANCVVERVAELAASPEK